jgi:hypothetical protein
MVTEGPVINSSGLEWAGMRRFELPTFPILSGRDLLRRQWCLKMAIYKLATELSTDEKALEKFTREKHLMKSVGIFAIC